MSISPLTAQTLAEERVSSLAESVGDEFVLLNDRTVEVEQGWIFFYNSKAFVETGNLTAALAGNGPILVTRTGETRHLPSAVPWEAAIKNER